MEQRRNPFAKGMAVKPGPRGPGIEARDFSGRAWELLQALCESGGLTTGAAAMAVNCSRQTASNGMKTLWYAGMAEWYDVQSTVGMFRLWLPVEARPPRDAQEACRMAVLGLCYSLAKHEVPGFRWQLTRNGKSHAMATLEFHGQNGPERWLVDAPRTEQEPTATADLYIFPTETEAKEMTPAGKRYTTDELLLEPGKLSEKIFWGKL
ncbi:MAG: hypothetical protein H0Z39_06940 [Peptococcaceae bacterium]|nr:hypothetical protein [Peptococcaceae bacterium]